MRRRQGWYAAVGRPAFFAMDPESAHRVALRLLGLPLPWSRIGNAIEHPALETTLAGVALRNPIGLAAGFDKTCEHLDALGALGFGYVVGGTVTRDPRPGNARPRIARSPARRALVNAMGLPNDGAAATGRHLAHGRRTCPRFVSLADEAVEDVVAALALVEPHADGIELNASSPNAGWEHVGEHIGRVVRELRPRTGKPLFVKLPPFTTPPERARVLAMAIAARDEGANGFTCSNTTPVLDRRLSTGRGGLSGGPLTNDTPRIVAEVLAATGGELPVNASGGVFTVADAARCLDAGAATVQVYTSLIYEGPALPGILARGLVARRAASRTLGVEVPPSENPSA
jgi:dihydroorotate dehydrogenase